MDSKQPVNFYFGGLEKSGIVSASESNDKSSLSYIIFQNDNLHGRVRELESSVSDLTNQVKELEDDNDSLEVSKTSLKGYVQNQGQYNKYSKNLVEIYDFAISGVGKQKEEFEWNIKFFGMAFIALEMSFFLYRLYNLDIFGIIEITILNCAGGYICMKVYSSYREFINIRNIGNVASVIKIKGMMKDASKGNDYLGDLVDKM